MSRVGVQYTLLVLTAFGLVVSQLLLKQGVKSGGAISITNPWQLVNVVRRILTTPFLLMGYGLSAITGLMWLVILSRLDLSYATPMLNGLYYTMLLVVSVIALREIVSPWRFGGTLLIVVGIFMIARGS